jgi:hypothetical protein
MSMDSDIKSVTITSTGVAVNNRARLRGIYYHNGSGVGTLTFKDSSTAQIVTWTFNSNDTGYQLLPGRGLLFNTNINCTSFTNMTSATLFYEG